MREFYFLLLYRLAQCGWIKDKSPSPKIARHSVTSNIIGCILICIMPLAILSILFFNADFWDGFRWSYQRMKDNTYKMKDDAYKTLVIKTR